MATRAEVEDQRTQQSSICTLAIAELVTLWKSLDLSNPAETEQELVQALPGLVQAYGQLSAGSAADFYDMLRQGIPGRFVASPSSLDLTGKVVGSTHWASSPLFSRTATTPDGEKVEVPADPDKALDRLSGMVQRNVLQHGRQTIADNAGRDPADARWARVPTGAETCAFCRILASRGAIYHTEQSAEHIGNSKHKYHDWCDCQPVVLWEGSSLPEGYDPDKYMQEYQDAITDSGVRNIHGIAKQMRKNLGVS